MVFPANIDLRRWGGQFLRGVRPRQDGRFLIEMLPPADYLAIAVAGLPENAWVDPYVLDRLWSEATPFRLDHGAQQVLQLELSPTPAGLVQ